MFEQATHPREEHRETGEIINLVKFNNDLTNVDRFL